MHRTLHITPALGAAKHHAQNIPPSPALAPGPIVYFLLHLSWLEQTYTWNLWISYKNIPYGQSSAKLSVIMSSCHPVILSSCHPVILSSCHPVILLSCHLWYFNMPTNKRTNGQTDRQQQGLQVCFADKLWFLSLDAVGVASLQGRQFLKWKAIKHFHRPPFKYSLKNNFKNHSIS